MGRRHFRGIDMLGTLAGRGGENAEFWSTNNPPRGDGRTGPPTSACPAAHAQSQYCGWCERPRDCRAAEQRDELAPVHSITSSARASSIGGTSSPSALAVLRLI